MAWTDYLVAGSVPAYGVGLLGLAVALWLLVLDPRSTVHRALAAFLLCRAGAHGSTALADAAPDLTRTSPFYEVSAFALVLSIVPLAVFALHVPHAQGTRRTRRTVVGATMLVPVVFLVISLASPVPALVLSGEWSVLAIAHTLLTYTGLAALPVAAWALSRHFARPDLEGRRSLWLMVLGFTVYPVSRLVRAFLNAVPVLVGGEPLTADALAEILLLGTTPFLLLATWRLARHRPWTTGPPIGVLALLAASAAVGYATSQGLVPRSTGVATVDVLFPALIVYGVLRHELFGLDVKVRLAVRQSTIAASFIAVFFVVSEGAAAFFESSSNSAFLGIAAAGLLVFALAPLQRLAERVATSAVPEDPSALPATSNERHALFRDAVALALRDGSIDRDEERDLLRMAGRLGLSNEEAFRLIDGVEGSDA